MLHYRVLDVNHKKEGGRFWMLADFGEHFLESVFKIGRGLLFICLFGSYNSIDCSFRSKI